MSRSRSRSPRRSEEDEDEAIAEVRKDLQHHVIQFNQKEGLNFDRLLARYRDSTKRWKASGETAQILKHTVHVAAWIAFGTRLFGRERGTVLQQLVSLLCEMLTARARVPPTDRLARALKFVAELCEDFEAAGGGTAWASQGLEHLRQALSDHERASKDGKRVLSRKSPVLAKQPAPPGTHGRTDHAFVRRVLGVRIENLPPGVRIYWDGHQRRWFASERGTQVRGSNALMKRFASDEEAIEFTYGVVMSKMSSGISG